MKHFGSKAGLLEAIFADTWAKITSDARGAMQAVASPRRRLEIASSAVVQTMEGDPELKLLMLLEGRRIRREGQLIKLTPDFMSFVDLIDGILDEMKAAGQIRANLNTQAIRSALMGTIEGMIRDRFLSDRLGYPANFDAQQVEEMMSLLLASCGSTELAVASSRAALH